MATLSIIGAGNVGITLGLLFQRQGYQIQDICNRSLASAQKGAGVIGAGRAVATYGDMQPADLLMVTTSDNALQTIAHDIQSSPAVKEGTIVFHCSGATPSEVLAPLCDKGAEIAGMHPVKSFTNPLADAESFSGTWCGFEGDRQATDLLVSIFDGFGGVCFAIDGQHKALYHAGIVFACNYLFPVIEAGLLCYEKAGVAREAAGQLLTPILHAAVDNALRLGPKKAITGPIARGDDMIVDKQLKALSVFDPDLKMLYEVLGSFATDLSVEKGVATPEKIATIRKLLSYDHYMQAAS